MSMETLENIIARIESIEDAIINGNKKTSDYAALPGGVPNDAWLLDIANAGVLNYKGTSLEFKDYVNAGKTGGKTIEGGTAPSEDLILDPTADATKGNIDLRGDTLLNTNQLTLGDGSDSTLTFVEYNSADTTNPYVEFNQAFNQGILNTSTMRLYAQETGMGAAFHAESLLAPAYLGATTRSASVDTGIYLGYLQNGNITTGTRKAWYLQHDNTDDSINLIAINDAATNTWMSVELDGSNVTFNTDVIITGDLINFQNNVDCIIATTRQNVGSGTGIFLKASDGVAAASEAQIGGNNVIASGLGVNTGANGEIIFAHGLTDLAKFDTAGDLVLLNGLVVGGSAPLTSVSTGVADNDKMVTQGYVDAHSASMKVAVPATKTSTGVTGNWAFDETTGYHYLCYDTDKWSRSIYTINW